MDIPARKRSDGTTGYTVQISIKRGGKIVHRESETFDREPAARIWIGKREETLAAPGCRARLRALAMRLAFLPALPRGNCRRGVGCLTPIGPSVSAGIRESCLQGSSAPTHPLTLALSTSHSTSVAPQTKVQMALQFDALRLGWLISALPGRNPGQANQVNNMTAVAMVCTPSPAAVRTYRKSIEFSFLASRGLWRRRPAGTCCFGRLQRFADAGAFSYCGTEPQHSAL